MRTQYENQGGLLVKPGTNQTSDATLYTQKYLHWYAKQNTPKGKRLIRWMIRIGKHVELLIDYKDKEGWTEQKAIVL